MAYGKRKFNKRNTKRVKTNTAKTKKGASSQANQIVKLQKQIDGLTTKTKDLTLRANFQDSGTMIMSTGDIPGGAVQGRIGLHVNELLRPKQLLPIFTTTAAFSKNNKVRVKKLQLVMDLTILPANNNEVVPVFPRFITIWIVTLKKETGRQLLQDSNNLNEINFNGLPNGSAYVYNTTGDLRQGIPSLNNRRGQYFLNPEMFNIRKVKRLIMGNTGISLQGSEVEMTALSAYAKRCKLTIPMNNVIQSGVGGTSWTDLIPAEMSLQDRMWMIAECQGWSTDTTQTDDLAEQKIQLNYQSIWTLEGNQ